MKWRSLCMGIIASLCAAFLYSCGNPVSPSKPNNYIQGKTYIGGDIKMQMVFPDDWLLTQDTAINNMQIQLLAWKSTFTQFRPNLNLIWVGHSGTANLNEILDTMSAEVMGTVQSPSILSKKLVQIDGNSFGEMVFDFTYNNIDLREKQLYFVHNDKDIMISFTDLKANYPIDSTDFNNIENSIIVQ